MLQHAAYITVLTALQCKIKNQIFHVKEHVIYKLMNLQKAVHHRMSQVRKWSCKTLATSVHHKTDYSGIA